MVKAYLLLVIAVMFEGLGTASLQATHKFTKLVPSLGVLVGIGGAFFCLVMVLQYLPLGITYAMWSGLGICLTVFLGWALFRQGVDLPALIGLALIIAGIVVINVFSKTATH